jgi:hypothetical protein
MKITERHGILCEPHKEQPRPPLSAGVVPHFVWSLPAPIHYTFSHAVLVDHKETK